MPDHPNPLPLLPLPDDLLAWLDQCGALVPLRDNGDDAADAIQSYARANMAPLAAEVERLRASCEALAAMADGAEAALNCIDDSACRCHESYKSRGMDDPSCNHDTADDVAVLRELLAALREESK